MKMLMIVARLSMLAELEELLRANAITAYTILNKAGGKGKARRVYETFLDPETNVVIMAVQPSDQVDTAVSALKALHAARLKASGGQVFPLKVFTLPCEEQL